MHVTELSRSAEHPSSPASIPTPPSDPTHQSSEAYLDDVLDSVRRHRYYWTSPARKERAPVVDGEEGSQPVSAQRPPSAPQDLRVLKDESMRMWTLSWQAPRSTSGELKLLDYTVEVSRHDRLWTFAAPNSKRHSGRHAQL